MLLVRGPAGGTTFAGTRYEPGGQPHRFRGAPEDAPYVRGCDEFYGVESRKPNTESDPRTAC